MSSLTWSDRDFAWSHKQKLCVFRRGGASLCEIWEIIRIQLLNPSVGSTRVMKSLSSEKRVDHDSRLCSRWQGAFGAFFLCHETADISMVFSQLFPMVFLFEILHKEVRQFGFRNPRLLPSACHQPSPLSQRSWVTRRQKCRRPCRVSPHHFSAIDSSRIRHTSNQTWALRPLLSGVANLWSMLTYSRLRASPSCHRYAAVVSFIPTMTEDISPAWNFLSSLMDCTRIIVLSPEPESTLKGHCSMSACTTGNFRSVSRFASNTVSVPPVRVGSKRNARERGEVDVSTSWQSCDIALARWSDLGRDHWIACNLVSNFLRTARCVLWIPRR